MDTGLIACVHFFWGWGVGGCRQATKVSLKKLPLQQKMLSLPGFHLRYEKDDEKAKDEEHAYIWPFQLVCAINRWTWRKFVYVWGEGCG